MNMKNLEKIIPEVKMSKTILVFAPHPDDEVLGVGGTILRKKAKGDNVVVCVATKNEKYDIRKKESDVAHKLMGIDSSEFLEFPDLGLDKVPHDDFTDAIRLVLSKYEPDEVYMPYIGDIHTDHKALASAILVAIRPKYKFSPTVAYMYETMSETGLDFQQPNAHFNPNVYIDISDFLSKKLVALSAYSSQIGEEPCSRSIMAIDALAKYRGAQAEMIAAEAFSLVREYIR